MDEKGWGKNNEMNRFVDDERNTAWCQIASNPLVARPELENLSKISKCRMFRRSKYVMSPFWYSTCIKCKKFENNDVGYVEHKC